MTHTEKVHVVYGILAVFAGGFALWHAVRPSSRARFVWPGIALLIGFCLFVPVEAQTRTYAEVGWWDTIRSLVPQDPRHWLGDWFATLAAWHAVQHKMGGLLIMAVGVIEWQRARGRLLTSRWGYALPVLLFTIGLTFGIHGGTSTHLPYRSEQVHHWILGMAFVLAAVVQALVEAKRLGGAWRGAWAMLILLVGLDIAFFYRLDPREFTPGQHHHASADPRAR